MKHTYIRIAIILMLAKTVSIADDFDFLSVHGYGSLGVAYQDDDDVRYRNSLHTNKGAQDGFSLANYTNLGLQIDAKATDKLTFTVQGILSENNSKGKLLELGWANINYEVSDSLSIKAGQMRMPAFMYSDILNVSYAYDWVKLPEMYSIIPFQNYRGVEINHNIDFDALAVQTTLMYGSSTNTIYNPDFTQSSIDVEKMQGIKLKLLYNDLTVHFTYSHNDINIKDKSFDNLMSQLRAINNPVINQTIDTYTPKKIHYWDIGGKYDFENAYVVGEYMELNSNSFLSDKSSWYVGTGYNFENWSPFLLYSKSESKSNYKNIAIDESMSAQTIGAITATNQSLNYISNFNNIDAETKSIGLRYNLYDNAVIKFQYDNQKALKNESLSFNTKDADVDIHVFSTAINFVF